MPINKKIELIKYLQEQDQLIKAGKVNQITNLSQFNFSDDCEFLAEYFWVKDSYEFIPNDQKNDE
jgi:hypothetical protein